MESRQQRRQRVELGALELFARAGFDGVTVDDICRHTGVSAATFYRYFPAKEDVLFGYHEAMIDGLRAAAKCAELGDPAERLFEIVRRFGMVLEREANDLALRENIMSGHPGLLGRALAIQFAWEAELAATLRPLAAAAADLWAAMGVAVIRVAWQWWRNGVVSSLAAGIEHALQTTARLGAPLASVAAS